MKRISFTPLLMKVLLVVTVISLSNSLIKKDKKQSSSTFYAKEITLAHMHKKNNIPKPIIKGYNQS